MWSDSVHNVMRRKTDHMDQEPTIAVILPCFNEAPTIGDVVKNFRAALPNADIYVYDNNSTDDTAIIAEQAGAFVRKEPRQGKGYVVRSIFQEIEADYYLMADGDDTYPAHMANDMLSPLVEGRAHMTVGERLKDAEQSAFRSMHKIGNFFITETINRLFQAKLTDVLSGYRGFTRDFVKTTPLLSTGFEIEVELTIHALDARRKIVEVPIAYRNRPAGSHSKLNTFRDGWLILNNILSIFKDYRPLYFFGLLSIVSFIFGNVTGLPVVFEFLKTGVVTRVPMSILAASLILLAMQFLGVGLVLHTMARGRRLTQELWILATKPSSSSQKNQFRRIC